MWAEPNDQTGTFRKHASLPVVTYHFHLWRLSTSINTADALIMAMLSSVLMSLFQKTPISEFAVEAQLN